MKDQLNRSLHIDYIPKRIVSIVPSQTELLFDLGLDTEVVGITKFCVHPERWFRNKVRVGGTKNINVEIVKRLKPDIILANKEENTKEDIELLQDICPVWVSDIQCFDHALEMIEQIGDIAGKAEKAQIIVQKLKTDRSIALNSTHQSYHALYLIWKNPYMAAGSDTFIHDMMHIAGFQNVISKSRYPVLEIETIVQLNPEVILLSSEPFPFKQKDIDELASILPASKIILVDGELFSWYGSRLLQSFDYFSALHEQI